MNVAGTSLESDGVDGDIEVGRHFCLTPPAASPRANNRRHTGSAFVVPSTPVNRCLPLPCGSCDSLVFIQDSRVTQRRAAGAPPRGAGTVHSRRPTEGPVPHVDLSPSPATSPTTADSIKHTAERSHPVARPQSAHARTALLASPTGRDRRTYTDLSTQGR